jgi:glucokinase
VTAGESTAGPPLPTIGIDIGGTSVRAAVVDAAGTVLAAVRDRTPRTEPDSEDLLVTLISKMAATTPVSAVGLAVAGFISADRHRVMFAPHLAWRDAPVPERLCARVQLPVVMDHDVNSAAWAEYRMGAAAGADVGLLVALGTGIGAGLVIHGEIYRGANGVAPELGHITVVPGGRPCPCGKRGCWERYCSGTALAETARAMMTQMDAPALGRLCGDDPDAVTGTMVAMAATERDPAALAAMDDLADWLAMGLALVTDVLDPDVIVIGGGVSAAAGMFLPLAVSQFAGQITGAGHRPVPRVELARFGDRAGLIGAALLAAHA